MMLVVVLESTQNQKQKTWSTECFRSYTALSGVHTSAIFPVLCCTWSSKLHFHFSQQSITELFINVIKRITPAYIGGGLWLLFRRSTSLNPTNPKHNPTNYKSINHKPTNPNPHLQNISGSSEQWASTVVEVTFLYDATHLDRPTVSALCC